MKQMNQITITETLKHKISGQIQLQKKTSKKKKKKDPLHSLSL